MCPRIALWWISTSTETALRLIPMSCQGFKRKFKTLIVVTKISISTENRESKSVYSVLAFYVVCSRQMIKKVWEIRASPAKPVMFLVLWGQSWLKVSIVTTDLGLERLCTGLCAFLHTLQHALQHTLRHALRHTMRHTLQHTLQHTMTPRETGVSHRMNSKESIVKLIRNQGF